MSEKAQRVVDAIKSNCQGSNTSVMYCGGTGGSAGIINVNSPIAMNGANNTINLNSGSYIFGQNINTASA